MRYAGVAAITILLSLPQLAAAQLVITEIMYDLDGADTGREWIEVYNSGATPIDVSKLKLFENGTNHKIVGSGQLGGQAYAVIADNPGKFKIDWPSYSGLLYDSAFNLGNDGDSISIRNASSSELASASYGVTTAAGDGNSLQRTSEGAFSAHTPTPGALMSSSVIPAKTKAVPVKTSKAKTSTAKVPKQTAVTKTSSSDAEALDVEAEDIPPSISSSETAAVGEAFSGGLAWWLGALGIAAVGAGGIFAARQYAKSEWDIVEEE